MLYFSFIISINIQNKDIPDLSLKQEDLYLILNRLNRNFFLSISGKGNRYKYSVGGDGRGKMEDRRRKTEDGRREKGDVS